MKKIFGSKNRAKSLAVISAIGAMSNVMATTAFANNKDNNGGLSNASVNIVQGADPNPDTLMGNILGILLTMARYVGIALIIYGVFEIVQSFMQNQPEAKTKGIIMALSGCVCVGLKSIIVGLNIIS